MAIVTTSHLSNSILEKRGYFNSGIASFLYPLMNKSILAFTPLLREHKRELVVTLQPLSFVDVFALHIPGTVFFQFPFQPLISQALFFFCKMHFPELFRIPLIIQDLIAELLAGQVKPVLTHHIITMVISAGPKYAIHLTAENVLGQKRRDRALSQRPVLRRPVLPKPRRAGVRAPYLRKHVI